MDHPSTSIAALLGLALLAVPGCGANVPGNCKETLKIQCAQLHECTEDQTSDQDADGLIDFVEKYGSDAAECESFMTDGHTTDLGGFEFIIRPSTCDEETEEDLCSDPALPNYDSKAAKDCLDAYETQACDAFNRGTVPEACTLICTA